MRVIIATDEFGRTVYINADKICCFHEEAGELFTKIYFDSGKCKIKGNKVKQILDYVTTPCNCEPILNLIDDVEVKDV